MSPQSDASPQLDDDVLSLFPYDTPRDAQLDGMDTVLDVVDDDGYLALEGACGTGKTILALAPLLNKVRDPSTKYERVLVVTSVKQQRWAFKEAVEDINTVADDPVSAVMLSGKADVTPYVRQGIIDEYDVYDEMETLRDNTRELIDQMSGDDLHDKRATARNLYERAETEYGDYPYGDDIPYYTQNGERIEYDPYYARHLAALYTREMEDAKTTDERVIPFNPKSEGVLTPEKLIDRAARQGGTSPHSVMGDLLTDDRMEVVIGNYYHIFDPTTAERLTAELFDEETLLVVDEAHNLVPDVRGLLGTDSSYRGFKGAANEVDEVVGWITGESDASRVVKARAQELSTSVPGSTDEYDAVADLLRAVHERLGERISSFIDDELGPRWWGKSEFEDLELSLRKPTEMTEDMLSQWIAMHPDLSKSTARNAADLLAQVYNMRQVVYEEEYGQKRLPNSSLQSAGNLITAWVDSDNTSYFRQVKLEEREYDPSDEQITFDWQNYYGATLEVNNCIPRDEIADTLDKFGAGVLMSATLEPLDVFEQVTGLDILEDKGRTLTRRRYGLPFPEENRISLAAEATDFRYNNRGDAFGSFGDAPNLSNDVRQEYADAILAMVDTTPGNVLVAMPSYSEAEWAGEVIKRKSSTVQRSDVIVDESSSDRETQTIKQRFFDGEADGEKRVLVTGAHGTLVEGVDYTDEKLLGVAVCGVPLQSTHKDYQKAIKTAYEDRFGEDNGFEFAFSLPAVYKARQTIGRVIRSDADLGARMLVDKRYTGDPDDVWGSVKPLFPDEELDEFDTADPDTVENRLEAFWKYHDK